MWFQPVPVVFPARKPSPPADPKTGLPRARIAGDGRASPSPARHPEMPRQRIETALEVVERAARARLAMRGDASDRSRGALPGLHQGCESGIVILLAPPAFADPSRLAAATNVAG